MKQMTNPAIEQKIEQLNLRNNALWKFDIDTLNKLDTKFILRNETGNFDPLHPLRAIHHEREDVFMWLYEHSLNRDEWIKADVIYETALANSSVWLTKFLGKLGLLEGRTHLPILQAISFLQGFNPLGAGLIYNNEIHKEHLLENLKYLTSLPNFEDDAIVSNTDAMEDENIGIGLGHNILSYAMFTNAWYLYDILWDKTFDKGKVFLWNLPMIEASLSKLYLMAHETFIRGPDNEKSLECWNKFVKKYPDMVQEVISLSQDFKFFKVEGPMEPDNDEPSDSMKEILESRGWRWKKD